MPFAIAILILIVVLIFSSMKVLNEYERGVMFTLGRFTGIKGPGIIFVWPARAAACARWTCASSCSTCPSRT